VYGLDAAVRFQKGRNGKRVRGVHPNAMGERLDAAHDEPAVERCSDCAARRLDGADRLKELVVRP
jgi:hypothetical protein